MSTQTQELAPKSSVREFFAELERVDKESKQTRPFWLNLPRFLDWKRNRGKLIAEITRRYAELDSGISLSDKNFSLVNVDSSTLKEAGGHLIKATCMADKEAKKRFRHDFEKIFKYDKGCSRIDLIFILKEGKSFSFSCTYNVLYTELHFSVDVDQDKNRWFSGEWANNDGFLHIKKFELHVRSEDEVKFLLDP